MRSHRLHNNRPVSLTTTASALVALVAIAAAMSSVPKPSHHRTTSVEARLGGAHPDGPTIRAVAQAVAAAARELVGAERIIPALALPARIVATILSDAPIGIIYPFNAADEIIASPMINERLLDLPPPAC